MFETSFTGSELYEPSSGQEFITIQGNAELDVTLSSNWVHIGSTAYLANWPIKRRITRSYYGQCYGIYSSDFGTRTNKDNLIGNGSLDTNTGEFNISFVMPSLAGIYQLSLMHKGDDPILSDAKTCNSAIGLESEFRSSRSEGDLVCGAKVLNAPLSVI